MSLFIMKLLSPPEQMPRLGLLAAQTALACQGVAHLSIPSDIGNLPKRCKNCHNPIPHDSLKKYDSHLKKAQEKRQKWEATLF